MAPPARARVPDPEERTFDMRSLRRLGIWGGSATFALLMAVVAGYSDASSRRGMAGEKPVPDAQTASRPPEVDTRRLADAVRVLETERAQLVARLDSVERNIEDITGAIKRQVEKSPVEKSPVEKPSPSGTSLPATDATAPGPAKEAARSATAEPPDVPAGRQPGGAAEPQPAARIAPVSAAGDEPPKAEFGVDVGGGANFGGLRTLWGSVKASNPSLLEGLHPLVAVRENSRTKGAELRLVIGPLRDVEAAARLCAALAAHRYCQPVAFEGQRLPDGDALPERKADAVPDRKPAPPPKPKPSAPHFPRLFP